MLIDVVFFSHEYSHDHVQETTYYELPLYKHLQQQVGLPFRYACSFAIPTERIGAHDLSEWLVGAPGVNRMERVAFCNDNMNTSREWLPCPDTFVWSAFTMGLSAAHRSYGRSL